MLLHPAASRRAATELLLADWAARSVDVRPRRPVVVTCLAGELLVTLEGDPVDHVLAPGEAFTAIGRGRLVVAALRPSRARVETPPSLRDRVPRREPRAGRSR